MTHHILYIAFHFPPIQISSGVHRTLAFSRYLAEQGHRVTVLTASKKAYPHYDDRNSTLIPENIEVISAYARDTARHFSLKNRYWGAMALPDRWQSWIIGGLISGLNRMRKHRPDVIISTYPIASAHIIAYLLHKITGIPWIADLRDPMLQQDYPANPRTRKIFAWLERKMTRHCQHILLTSPGALALYRDRYPQVADRVWQVLPNGFDEKLFAQTQPLAAPAKTNTITLLHSGTIYPSERDPTDFFQALAVLKQQHPEAAAKLKVVLRSTGHDALFAPMLKQAGVADMVALAPALNYVEALDEMLSADALLLLQASNCNYQTPAKAYEYIRAKRPVLALTDKDGDTAALISQSKMAEIAPLNSSEQIVSALLRLIENIEQQRYQPLPDEQIALYSRQHQAQRLHLLLTDLFQPQPAKEPK